MASPDATPLVLPYLLALKPVDGTEADGVLQLAEDRLVHQVVQTWRPLLVRMRADDASWEWAQKASDVCYTTGVEHVMITHEDKVQGVMVTSLPDVPPSGSSLRDILYVEYLAVAPWNRLLAGAFQQFKGIGTRLLRHAVRRSTASARKGQLGLHSEPGAIAFYEQIRLRRCGPDPDQDHRQYFEGDAGWASQFLAGR